MSSPWLLCGKAEDELGCWVTVRGSLSCNPEVWTCSSEVSVALLVMVVMIVPDGWRDNPLLISEVGVGICFCILSLGISW